MAEPEWIKSSEAVRRLLVVCGSRMRAAHLLEERAAVGLLTARAELRIETRKTRGPDIVTEHADEVVPRWAWQGRRQGRAETSFEWSVEKYTAWRLSHSEIRFRSIECLELFGLMFCNDEISKLLPTGTDDQKSKGHNLAPSRKTRERPDKEWQANLRVAIRKRLTADRKAMDSGRSPASSLTDKEWKGILRGLGHGADDIPGSTFAAARRRIEEEIRNELF